MNRLFVFQSLRDWARDERVRRLGGLVDRVCAGVLMVIVCTLPAYRSMA